MQSKLIVVASYPTTVEADIARMRLADVGIAACLSDEAIVANFAILTTAVQGIKVLVVDADAQRAREILNEGDPEELASGRAADEREPWTCVTCGASVEATFDTCWSCGTSRSGEEDPAFITDAADATSAVDPTATGHDQAVDQPSGLAAAGPSNLDDEANPYRSPRVQVGPAARLTDPLEEEMPSDADAGVMRAWRAAVFGLFLCPPLLNVYSAVLLILLANGPLRLTRRSERYYAAAWIINVLAVAGATVILRLTIW